jgi:hypothetical protein
MASKMHARQSLARTLLLRAGASRAYEEVPQPNRKPLRTRVQRDAPASARNH